MVTLSVTACAASVSRHSILALLRAATLTGAFVAISACATAARIAPLSGVAPSNAALPVLGLATSAQRVTFKWELDDNSNGDPIVARGDGVARLAPPDSARIDLFLGGGFGAAAAVLVGDSLRLPSAGGVGAMIPPPPLLWAALGRLALPAISDTIVRVSGDTLRASLGRPVQWRVTSVGNTLTRVERISGDRIVEWVERVPGKHVRYELSGRRSLVLDIENQQPAAAFDASIWRF